MKGFNDKKELALAPYFDSLFELSSDILLKYNPKDHIIIDTNAKAVDFWEYSRDTMVGLYLEDIGISVSPTDLQHLNIKGLQIPVKLSFIPIQEDVALLKIDLKHQPSSPVEELYQLPQTQFNGVNNITKKLDEYADEKIGPSFFQAMINGLCNELSADYIFLAEITENKTIARTVYMSERGNRVDNISYQLKGSPCALVTLGNSCIYPKNIQQLFPNDQLLIEMEINSYAGIPISIRDINKEGAWILVALFKNTIKDQDVYKNILEIAAKKIQAEKERSLLLNVIVETERRYKRLFQHGMDTILIIDPKSKKILDSNNKATILFGYTPDEFLELSVLQLRADIEESPPNESTLFKNILSNHEVRFEALLITKDQTTFIAEVSATLINDNQKNYVKAIVRDISDEFQKDAELKENKLLLEKSQELGHMGSWELKLEKMALAFSRTHYAIADMDESISGLELYNYYKSNRIHPDDLANWEEQINLSVESKSSFEYSYKIILPDGKIKYLKSIGVIVLDPYKNAYKILGTTQDITHSISQENKFKNIYDSFVDMYYEADMDGIFTMVSPSVINIFGVPPEKLIGTKLINTYKNPNERNRLLEELNKKGHSKSFQTIVYNIDGEEVAVEANVKLRKDIHGNSIGIMGVVRDISERLQKEILLEEKQYRLEKSQEIAQVGSWEYDIKSDKHLWSSQHYKIFELDETCVGDRLYKAFRKLVHPEDLILIDSIVKTPNPQNTNFDYAYRLLFEEGRIKHLISKGQIIWDEDNQPIKVIGTIQDVTTQKNLEEELAKANEAEFAKLYHQQKVISEELGQKNKEVNRFFELSTDMICIIKKNGQILRVNPSFSRVLGYSEKEFMSKSLYHFIHPDDLIPTLEIGQAFSSDHPVSEYKNRYITKDATIKWLSWHSFFDSESDLIFAVVRDITETQKASKEIQDLKYTLDQTAIVITLNSEKQITNVNNKFCATTLFSRTEVIGQPYGLFFYENQETEGPWQELNFDISAGEVWRGELIAKKKNGDIYWADTSIVPFYDLEGNPLQYIAIQSDITQRKKLEIDLRNSKEDAIKLANIKENFLANMSHEIRTPMNAILGFSQLLVKDELEEILKMEYANTIHSSAENLLIVINDILDFSKINSDKFQLEQVSFNLRKDIHQVMQTLGPSFHKKKLVLELIIDEQIPELIKAASNRISQVIINLLSNAVKFTATGSVTLKIKLLQDQKLFFEVTDTGIGISPDKLEYIFDSFTQAENYTTRVYGGTGLGLSISQKLVQKMGGNIHVKSELNKGSVFYFSIPFEPIAPVQNKVSPVNNTLGTPSFHNFKILVVEDNLLNQKLIKVHLKKFNCSFDLVENGQEAIEAISSNEYDMILMDIQMPIIDGIEATKIIRAQGCQTPIIAMTAHALEKEKQIYIDIGMNDYIPKPFRQEEFQRLVQKYYLKKEL